jgi:carbonic anhydrase
VLDCPLVVVLGHDSCGAVAATRAALTDGLGTNSFVRDVIERVTPSVLAAHAAGLTEDDDIIAEHIRGTVDLLVDRSRLLADNIAAGLIAIVGLSYQLADGSARVISTRGIEAEETATA